ncbi:hypothetical protein [Moorena sp. SIO4E2]|nr:hypothetical protein [Moorena sp. SIO4E2]
MMLYSLLPTPYSLLPTPLSFPGRDNIHVAKTQGRYQIAIHGIFI